MDVSAVDDATVLYVDDDPDLAAVVAEMVEREDDAITVLTETDPEAGLDRLRATPVDCVVSDYDMPEMDGLAFLRAVREQYSELPFVLFTGNGSERLASEAIAAGVTEYLPKGSNNQYAMLANRIRRVVAEHRAHEARGESERMLSTLIENLPGMVYRCRNEQNWPMEWVGGNCVELTGYTAEELTSGTVDWAQDVIHPDDRGEMWDAVQSALDADEPFEVTYRIRRKDGDVRWVWERGEGLDKVNDTLLEGFITDVTDRKQRERELERYETIVQAVGDPVYVLDEAGEIAFVNDATAAMTGYAKPELRGTHIGRILSDGDVETGREHIRQLLDEPDRRGVKFEVSVETKDGDTIPCELHVALLPTADGEFRGTAGIIRDIEERKAREQRLEKFASVVSHDLRGPLNVIAARVDLARNGDGNGEHLTAIEDSVERMDDLIEDLLTLARQGRTVGDRSDVELSTVARRAWQSVNAPDAALETDADVRLRADPDRLRDLFVNLFRNAVEHGSTGNRTESGDAVEHGSTSNQTQSDDAVEHGSTGNRTNSDVRQDDGDAVTVRVGTPEQRDGFYVADDGPGVPEDDCEAVFEHGYTTSESGSGFGLSIVEAIVEAHGWSIDVTESADGGARFEVEVDSGDVLSARSLDE